MKEKEIMNRSKQYLFALLPFSLLIPALGYTSKLPANWAYFFDPSYAYLLNGLGVLTGHRPNLIQHPGISMEIYVGIVVFLTTILSGETNFAMSVLQNPEKYLQSLAYFNLFILLSAVLAVSKSIQKNLGFSSLFLFQFSLVACLNLFLPFVLLAMPEFLVLTSSFVCLSIIIGRRFNASNQALSTSVTFTLGFFLATGLMAKVIFAPIFCLVFIVVGKVNFQRLLLTTILFTTVYLAFIPNRILEMFQWFLGTSKSLNRYDAPSGYDSNLILYNYRNSLATIESSIGPLFSVFLIVTLIFTFLLFVFRFEAIRSRILVGIFTTIFAVLLTGYKAGLSRDFVLIGALIPTTFALINHKFLKIRLWKILIPFNLILLTVSSYSNLEAITQSMATNRIISEKAQNDIENVHRIVGESWLIGQYGILSKNSALQFGNNWAGSHFSTGLAKMYPKQIEFNVWDRNFYYNVPNLGLTILPCEKLAEVTRGSELYVLVLNNTLGDRLRQENSLTFSENVQMIFSDKQKFDSYTLFEKVSIKCVPPKNY